MTVTIEPISASRASTVIEDVRSFTEENKGDCSRHETDEKSYSDKFLVTRDEGDPGNPLVSFEFVIILYRHQNDTIRIGTGGNDGT